MAHPSKQSEPTKVLVQQVANLLRGYEEFRVYYPVSSYDCVMELRTEVMVHRKHTKRGLFVPNSVYQASSHTSLPNLDFIEAWLPNAREAAEKFISKGEFTVEKIINGEWQSVKAKYNQWIYYDHKNSAMIGEVQSITQPATNPKDNTE